MTIRRAVTYGGISCLLAAWLASAASTSRRPRGTEGSATEPPPDALTSELQAPAAKLRARLASLPLRPSPSRNPFVFEVREAPPVRQAARPADEPPLPPPAATEPALSLIGIAEDSGPKGLIRTAMLADETEALIMVTVGQTFMERYRVEAVGAEAVELKDLTTGAIRRLALR